MPAVIDRLGQRHEVSEARAKVLLRRSGYRPVKAKPGPAPESSAEDQPAKAPAKTVGKAAPTA